MSEDNLYFNTSEADNLGKYIEPDPTVGTPSDVKLNYVYKDAVSHEPSVGTMPINEDGEYRLDLPEVFIIPQGYHSGKSKIYTGPLSEYTPGNALPSEVANNKVFWVNGERRVGTLDMSKITQPGTATASDIVHNKTAWVNGTKITGTIPVLSRQDKTLLAGQSYTFPYGLSAGTTVITAASLASQTQGTATAGMIFKGETAWVNGNKLTGTYDIASYIKEFLKDTNALQNQVVAGAKFYSAKYDAVMSGTMTNHTGEATRTLTNGQLWNIPEGYYDGNSSVRVASLADVTPGTAEADDIKYGLTAWANGVKLTGSAAGIDPTEIVIAAGASYTIPKGFHSGSGKVTATGLSPQTSGTAEAADIKLDKTAWVNGVKLTGTMPIYAHISKEVACGETYIIPHGYHDGGGWVYCKDLASQTQATATADKILKNETAWVNGVKLTGSMPNIGKVEDTINAGETYAIPAGYHNGEGKIHAKGIGPQTEGTATPSDILKPKTAWVNGEKLTGTLELTGNAMVEDVLEGCTFYNTNAKTKVTGTLALTGNASEMEVIKGYTFYNEDAKTKLTGTLELVGNAQTQHVLAGEIFYTNDPRTPYTGTMVSNTPEIVSLDGGEIYYIAQGYHTGVGYVRAKSISEQTPGTATATDIIKGKTAWVEGNKITGTLEFTGTAYASGVLVGTTFYTTDPKTKYTGSMPNVGEETNVLYAGETHTISQGYHDGTGVITAMGLAIQTPGDATENDILKDKKAWVNGVQLNGNIETVRDGEVVLAAGDEYSIPFGFRPSSDINIVRAKDLASQTVGTATAGDIRKSKVAWVNGSEIIGTINDYIKYTVTEVPAGTTVPLNNGYYESSSISTASLASQTVSDAIASELIYNKTAWANGVKITGTMPNIGKESETLLAGSTHTISKGYHDGTGVITAKDLASQTVATATAASITDGKTAWVNGLKVTGTMTEYLPYKQENVLCGKTINIPDGHHVGSYITTETLANQTVADAAANHILKDKTSWVNGTKLTGTMPNIGKETDTISAGNAHMISKGYHDGTGVVVAKDLASQTVGDAVATEVIVDKTAWVNGVKIVGTMPSIGKEDETLLAGETHTISKGYHDGTGVITSKDLASQTPGDAAANHILNTKIAWVAGNKVTGTMPNIGSESETLIAGATHTISKGYHDGTGIITATGIGPQTEGTATAADILAPKTAWVNGVRITGTIESKSQSSITLSAGQSITIPAGYYASGFTITAEDLGSQTPGTASAGDIVEDATAWVSGVQITGTIPDGDEQKY